MVNVRQGGIKYHFLSHWYDSTWDWTRSFTSHFICKVSKRVTQSLRVRGSWGPNITEYFDPEVMAVSVVSFSFSMVAQPDPGVNSSGAGFPYYLASTSVFTVLFAFFCLSPTVLNSSALYYLRNSHAVI